MCRSKQFATEIQHLKRSKKLLKLGDFKWHDKVENQSGVYVLWKDNTACYVGESANLKERLKDLTRWRNHSFRRRLKNRANLSEEALTRRINRDYKISWVTMASGRKELEEHLIADMETTEFNKTPARYLRSADYVVH